MRRVTIKDIAQIAGVSYSTVSRALTGSHEVSEATRSRILEICKAEGYRVNVLARSLISSKTNVIGLIVPDVSNPFYAEVALGIEIHARSLGYNIMLCNSLHDPVETEKLFELLIGHQVDGIILASSHNEASRWVKQYGKTVPIVLLGAASPGADGEAINSVTVDNRAGGHLAAQHLISLGHRSILYFGLRPSSITHKLRFQGFSSAMENAGLQTELMESPEDSSSIEHGYALGKQLFSAGCHSTAIFAATDSLALGLLEAANEFGLHIPDDISLLGFDNIVYTSLPNITLSTVDQRMKTLAQSAINLLVDLIAAPQQDEYTHRLIRPSLVVRTSTKRLC